MCVSLGYKTPIPSKQDLRAWRELQQAETEKKQRQAAAAQRARVRQRHALEQEISRLEAMPKNAGRASAIRTLRRRLGDV